MVFFDLRLLETVSKSQVFEQKLMELVYDLVFMPGFYAP